MVNKKWELTAEGWPARIIFLLAIWGTIDIMKDVWNFIQ